MSRDILDLLERLGTSGVSDVLDAARRPRPILQGLRPVTSRGAIAGRAITVQIVPVVPGEGRPARHLCVAAVEAGNRDSIVVVAVDGDPRISGSWGGLLSLAAHTRGLRGTVVAGLCRDSDEIAKLGYPVYAMGTTPTTARGRLKEQATDVPIRIGEVTVSPGDYVVADGDGVIALAAGEVENLIGDGQMMLATEKEFEGRILGGESLADVLDESYESMTEERRGG